jgi:hypothetical protein
MRKITNFVCKIILGITKKTSGRVISEIHKKVVKNLSFSKIERNRIITCILIRYWLCLKLAFLKIKRQKLSRLRQKEILAVWIYNRKNNACI